MNASVNKSIHKCTHTHSKHTWSNDLIKMIKIRSGYVCAYRTEESDLKLLLVELEATNCWQPRRSFPGQVDLLNVTAWSLTRNDAARENGRTLNWIFFLITRWTFISYSNGSVNHTYLSYSWPPTCTRPINFNLLVAINYILYCCVTNRT